MKDYYQVLGIKRNTSDDEIKKAYRTLAKANHPDLNPDNSTKESLFKEIQEAYDAVLRDRAVQSPHASRLASRQRKRTASGTAPFTHRAGAGGVRMRARFHSRGETCFIKAPKGFVVLKGRKAGTVRVVFTQKPPSGIDWYYVYVGQSPDTFGAFFAGSRTVTEVSGVSFLNGDINLGKFGIIRRGMHYIFLKAAVGSRVFYGAESVFTSAPSVGVPYEITRLNAPESFTVKRGSRERTVIIEFVRRPPADIDWYYVYVGRDAAGRDARFAVSRALTEKGNVYTLGNVPLTVPPATVPSTSERFTPKAGRQRGTYYIFLKAAFRQWDGAGSEPNLTSVLSEGVMFNDSWTAAAPYSTA